MWAEGAVSCDEPQCRLLAPSPRCLPPGTQCPQCLRPLPSHAQRTSGAATHILLQATPWLSSWLPSSLSAKLTVNSSTNNLTPHTSPAFCQDHSLRALQTTKLSPWSSQTTGTGPQTPNLCRAALGQHFSARPGEMFFLGHCRVFSNVTGLQPMLAAASFAPCPQSLQIRPSATRCLPSTGYRALCPRFLSRDGHQESAHIIICVCRSPHSIHPCQ